MRIKRTQQRGFSAIELMMVLVVASVLLAIAIPGFQNVIRSSLLTSGADKLSASLNLARTKAIMSRRNVRLCPSTNGTTCTTSGSWTGGWIMFVDSDGNGAPSTSELLQARGAMDSRISLTTPAAFTQYIQFRPTGVVLGNAGTSGQFDFCSGNYHEYSRLVGITTSGRVTTKKQADLCNVSS
jgi:type IV fimbrial biogenesis protein FimT